MVPFMQWFNSTTIDALLAKRVTPSPPYKGWSTVVVDTGPMAIVQQSLMWVLQVAFLLVVWFQWNYCHHIFLSFNGQTFFYLPHQFEGH